MNSARPEVRLRAVTEEDPEAEIGDDPRVATGQDPKVATGQGLRAVTETVPDHEVTTEEESASWMNKTGTRLGRETGTAGSKYSRH